LAEAEKEESEISRAVAKKADAQPIKKSPGRATELLER
jgi:hypothetical protein